MNAPVIAPTVGRKVWFRTNGIKSSNSGILTVRGNQPMDATVVFVWSDRMVNLTVLDHAGWNHPITSVPLLQAGDTPPVAGCYCEWMPYQVGQAAKASSAGDAK